MGADTLHALTSMDHLPAQTLFALVVSYLLFYLKHCRWFPFLTDETSARVQIWWGGIAAAVTAAGIHLSASGSLLDGSTGMSITVTGLSLNALKDVALQWAAQQAWYDGLIRQRVEAIRRRKLLERATGQDTPSGTH